jgi:hypothetical protein
MKRFILHIGSGKAGTSSLQYFLATNIETLQRKHCSYIELEDLSRAKKGETSSGNGARLARSFLPPAHPFFLPEKASMSAALASFLRATQCDILVSSEFFSMLPVESIRELTCLVATFNYEVHPVFYIRRQDHMALSAYIQGLKFQHSQVARPFTEEVRNISDRFNYFRTICAWDQMETVRMMNIRIYEQKSLIDGDIVADFLHAMGLGSIAEYKRRCIINRPLSPAAAIFLYQARKSGVSEAVVQRMLAMERNYAGQFSYTMLLPLKDRREILLEHKYDNNQILIKYFPSKVELFDCADLGDRTYEHAEAVAAITETVEYMINLCV